MLLAAQGMSPPRISELVFSDPGTVRDVIHDFNRDGFEALYPCYRGSRPQTLTLPKRLKDELLYRGVWPTRAAARRAIFEYVEVFYSRQRTHPALGCHSPVDYEARSGDLQEAQAA